MAVEIDHVALAAQLVGAFVSNNSVAADDLPALIASVHATITKLATGVTEEPIVELKPAVAVKKSITPEHLVCLEDGKKFKSLKRHLSAQYGLSPEEYRAKWGLTSDYPMVAPNYAAARSALAKKMGLGQQRQKAAPAPAAPAPAAKKRGRPKAA